MLTVFRTVVAIGVVAGVLTLTRPALDIPGDAGHCLGQQLDLVTTAGATSGVPSCHRGLQGRLAELGSTLPPWGGR